MNKMLKTIRCSHKHGRSNTFAQKSIIETNIWNKGKSNIHFFNGIKKSIVSTENGIKTTSRHLLMASKKINGIEAFQDVEKNKSIHMRREKGIYPICGNEKNICSSNSIYFILNRGNIDKRMNCFHFLSKHFSTNNNIVHEKLKQNNQIKEENNKYKDEKKTNVNTSTKEKTKKQIFIDRQYKEKLIKTYLLLSFFLIPSGYFLMTCIQNNISFADLIEMGKKKSEILENKCTEKMNEFIEKYFPLSNEPLLPDFKDLNYPEHLPTLVLDLNYVIAKLEYDRKVGWRVLKRPYADLFFKELSSFYEIVIWSDDNFPVAQEVISKWGVPAIGCLHRDQCIKKKKSYVKDLKRLGRNLDRVIIIDHDPNAFMLHPENGILIKEFNGNINDKELLCLIDFLKAFAVTTIDVTTMLKKHGGGDYDIGRRYMQFKNDKEQKSKRIRSIGKIFHVDGKRSSTGVFNS